MQTWIRDLGRKRSRHLSFDEAAKAAEHVISGAATDAQVSAFLMGMRVKGEHEDELSGWTDVFRRAMPSYPSVPDSVHCAGSGEPRAIASVNVPVSLLLASVGIPHVLQGERRLPMQSGVGLGELLKGLGVHAIREPACWAEAFRRARIGCFQAEALCPVLARLRPVREQIGLSTMLNTVERLLNPLGSGSIVIGVPGRKGTDALIQALSHAGYRRAYAIQGIEGSEDLPLHKKSRVHIWNGVREDRIVDPAAFGFASVELLPADREAQARQVLRVLRGEDHRDIRALREHVVFNAGLRMVWLDKLESYEEAFALARNLLDQGAGLRTLEHWRLSGRRASPSGGDEPPLHWSSAQSAPSVEASDSPHV